MWLLSISSVIASIPVIYLAVRACYYLWWRPKRLERQLGQQGIHGNPYKLLYGDLKEQARILKEAWSKPGGLTHSTASRRAMPDVHTTIEKYGKKSLMWIGTTPRVILWDAEQMKEILSEKSCKIRKPPLNPLIKLLVTGIGSLEGDEWACRRKMINPAFHMEKLKNMVPSVVVSCQELVEHWQKLTEEREVCELDVWPEFQSLTGDIISRTAFGSNYEEGKMIFELQKEQANLVLEASRSVYIPGLRFLPTAKNKRRMYLDREIKTMLKKLIFKKEVSMRQGDSCSYDLLGLLLQYVEHSNTQGKDSKTRKYRIRVEDVIEECKLFYFAGQETTSVWLTWTVISLAMHPSWQEKAREEIQRICGGKQPDFESINHLKIVTMILDEVLRLYPPLTGLLRYTRKDAKFGGINYPEGVELLLPAIFIHHDPEYWGEDAAEFNPERFAHGVSKASKDQNAFFPFGWGPRVCPGQNFAIIEAKIGLAMILKHFSFELSPSYMHAPYTVVTLHPQYGAQIILKRL